MHSKAHQQITTLALVSDLLIKHKLNLKELKKPKKTSEALKPVSMVLLETITMEDNGKTLTKEFCHKTSIIVMITQLTHSLLMLSRITQLRESQKKENLMADFSSLKLKLRNWQRKLLRLILDSKEIN